MQPVVHILDAAFGCHVCELFRLPRLALPRGAGWTRVVHEEMPAQKFGERFSYRIARRQSLRQIARHFPNLSYLFQTWLFSGLPSAQAFRDPDRAIPFLEKLDDTKL